MSEWVRERVSESTCPSLMSISVNKLVFSTTEIRVLPVLNSWFPTLISPSESFNNKGTFNNELSTPDPDPHTTLVQFSELLESTFSNLSIGCNTNEESNTFSVEALGV